MKLPVTNPDPQPLLMRWGTAADTDAVLDILTNKHVLQSQNHQAYTYAQAKQYATQSQTEAYHYQMVWRFVLEYNNTIIGTASISVTNHELKHGAIGYSIHPNHWGQGHGSDAAKQLIQYGFNTLGLNRISAHCTQTNTASTRVMEKAGMTYEGYTAAGAHISGQWVNVLNYAILSPAMQQIMTTTHPHHTVQ